MGVHKGSLMVMLRLKKAGRKCLGEDVETFNDPRHLAIISVKIDFFLNKLHF